MSNFLNMEQMANELNLSRRVISAVLNNRASDLRISQATEKRVREYLDRAGYVRSKSALQLKNGTSDDMVGILYCGKYLELEYMTASLGILTAAIRQRCGFAEINGVESSQLHQGVREFISKGVRKLIWIHANPSLEEFINAELLFPLFSRLEKVVIYKYDFFFQELTAKYLEHKVELVGFDSEKSYRQAVELLVGAGHTKVAINDVYYDSNIPLKGNQQLFDTFSHASLEVSGIYPEEEVDPADLPRVIAQNLIRLHRERGVKAAFLRNDLLAAQVMGYLLQAGLKIPQDIAVIGFSGSRYSKWLPVPLTTFEHPIEAMCGRTLDLIWSTEKHDKAQCHIFDNQLVLRSSH